MKTITAFILLGLMTTNIAYAGQKTVSCEITEASMQKVTIADAACGTATAKIEMDSKYSNAFPQLEKCSNLVLHMD